MSYTDGTTNQLHIFVTQNKNVGSSGYFSCSCSSGEFDCHMSSPVNYDCHNSNGKPDSFPQTGSFEQFASKSQLKKS